MICLTTIIIDLKWLCRWVLHHQLEQCAVKVLCLILLTGALVRHCLSDGVSHPQFPGSKHGFHDYDDNFWTLGLPLSLNQAAQTLSLIWPLRNSSFLSKFQGLILGSTRYTNSVQFYSAPRFVFVKTMACQSQQPSDVQAESTTPGHIHMPPRNKGLEKSKKRKECKDLIYDLLIKILLAMLGGVDPDWWSVDLWMLFQFFKGSGPLQQTAVTEALINSVAVPMQIAANHSSDVKKCGRSMTPGGLPLKAELDAKGEKLIETWDKAFHRSFISSDFSL